MLYDREKDVLIPDIRNFGEGEVIKRKKLDYDKLKHEGESNFYEINKKRETAIPRKKLDIKEKNTTEEYRLSVRENLLTVEAALEWRLLQGRISKIDLIDYFVPHLEEVRWLEKIFSDDSSIVFTTPKDFNKDFRVKIKNIYGAIIDSSYEYLSKGDFEFESKYTDSITNMRQALLLLRKVKFLQSRLEGQIPLIAPVNIGKVSATTSELSNETEE